ncbi:MAG TPA: SLC13 family permease [Pyrinomonadaceae bacterium]|nr:SLC13 family permease [Pyrinomonadaceae bacterium]
MFANLNPQQIAFLVILIIALVLFVTEWIRTDVVAVLIVIALYVARVLKPEEALSGFSSEPAIVIAGIFVLSGALHATGLSDQLGDWIGRFAGKSLTRAIAVIMPSVAALSAFTHHVTTTAVMLPITLDLSRERKLPASKLLMPMSFAASLGTTITIIGAPAFLIASTTLQQSGRPGLGIFSIAPIGLSMTAAGTVFVLFIGRFLLPAHKGEQDASHHFRLEDYLTEIALVKGSPFIGQTVNDLTSDENIHFTVAGIIRHGRRVRGTIRNEELKEGDVLIVRTTPEELVSIRKDTKLTLRPVKLYGESKHEKQKEKEDGDEDGSDLFVQAVVAPRSDLVGQTISNIDFHRRYGSIVVGLWRKDGWLAQEVSKVKLRANDLLVLEGDEEALARVSSDSAFLMLVPFHAEAQVRGRAWMAGAIMLATILLAAFNLMTIEMAAITGAAAVVLSGCITPNQAYRSIDARIFVFIAGAIPLGTAMQKTGTANVLAGSLQHAVTGWPEWIVLLVIFAFVAVITQFMSDSATTALFAPVAVALAQALGRPPEPYVVTVAMASVIAFLTPIGHHGNLLVYGPGQYKFGDFVKVGTPLTIICAVIVVLLAPLIWRG